MTLFDQTEAWVPYEQILGAGTHTVTIESAEADTSKNGHPQVTLKFRNAQGVATDWRVITEGSFGHIVQLAKSTGVHPSDEEKAYFDSNGLKAPKSWLGRLVGKRVAIVVIEEPKWDDATKTQSRVQGYLPPGSDTTPAEDRAGTASAAFSGGSQQVADDDIPF
jgi:hypothetical protein